MSSTQNDIFAGLDLGGATDTFDEFSVDLAEWNPKGGTTRLKVGEPTLTTGTLAWRPVNPLEVPVTAVLQPGGQFRQLTTKGQMTRERDDRPSMLMSVATGQFSNVAFEFSIELPSGATVSLPQLLLGLVNRNAPVDRQVTMEKFLAICHTMGFRPDGAMSMLFQQMRADEDKVASAMALMERHGAVDTTAVAQSKNEKIARQVAFPDDHQGMPLVGIEISGMDRNMSPTSTGFIDIVNAAIESFQFAIEERRIASVLNRKLTENANSGRPWKDETVKDKQREIGEHRARARNWIAGWGGRHQEVAEAPDGSGKLIPTGAIYPDNIPCGTFTVLDSDRNEVTINVWTNTQNVSSTPANPTQAAQAIVDATTGDDTSDDDSEPF